MKKFNFNSIYCKKHKISEAFDFNEIESSDTTLISKEDSNNMLYKISLLNEIKEKVINDKVTIAFEEAENYNIVINILYLYINENNTIFQLYVDYNDKVTISLKYNPYINAAEINELLSVIINYLSLHKIVISEILLARSFSYTTIFLNFENTQNLEFFVNNIPEIVFNSNSIQNQKIQFSFGVCCETYDEFKSVADLIKNNVPNYMAILPYNHNTENMSTITNLVWASQYIMQGEDYMNYIKKNHIALKSPAFIQNRYTSLSRKDIELRIEYADSSILYLIYSILYLFKQNKKLSSMSATNLIAVLEDTPNYLSYKDLYDLTCTKCIKNILDKTECGSKGLASMILYIHDCIK